MTNFFQNIVDLIKKTTGLDCIPTPGDVFQTSTAIHYTDKPGYMSFLIHEFGHFLAANKRNRQRPNLGFPLFEEETELNTQTSHVLSELKTVYFTHLIFNDYLSKTLNYVIGEDKKAIDYMIYLCSINDKKSIMTDLQINDIRDIKLGIWDKQLDRKLKALNTSLSELHLILDKMVLEKNTFDHIVII